MYIIVLTLKLNKTNLITSIGTYYDIDYVLAALIWLLRLKNMLYYRVRQNQIMVDQYDERQGKSVGKNHVTTCRYLHIIYEWFK